DEATIDLRMDSIRQAGAAPIRKAPVALVPEEDEPLLAALKSKRRALAEAARAPAYVIFPDRTLIEMATHKPRNLDEFSRLNGVGAKKLEKFGAVFLEVINEDTPDELHPSRRKIAGSGTAQIYDRLAEAAKALEFGESGTQKPLSCAPSLLVRIAKARPRDADGLARVSGMDANRIDRFGTVFLEILAD
ncbi:MAG TPA: HRDC domain-containing protein, partial [Paracoccaceae bacterium]|nr:HRDC domain-containing protein [Paracoccaceae bacterium]